MEGVDVAGVVEGTERFFVVLEVDPPDDVGHGGSCAGGGEEEWGEEFLGDGVPEVGVLEPAAFSGSGGGCEPGCHAEGALPVAGAVEW